MTAVASSVAAAGARASHDAGLSDPSSVYRVVRATAEHDDGWEQAMAAGVAELAKSITDLRVARVLDTSLVTHDDGRRSYRVTFAASYRVDRARSLPSGATSTVRRYLVVASQTASGRALHDEIARLVGKQRCEFHLVMPVQLPSNEVSVWSDPMSGYSAVPAGDDIDRETLLDAERRLAAALERIRAAGGAATGEVATVDPVKAALTVLDRGSFDEIILSTLPRALSRWLKLDPATRLRHRTNLPVLHVEQLDAGDDLAGCDAR